MAEEKAKEYAIMRIKKLKSEKTLGDAYYHNFRIYNVTNADAARRDENIEYGSLNGRSYLDTYNDTISHQRLQGAISDRKIRKDAVKGFEVVLRYSHEANERIDLDAWIKANIEWLERTFNPKDGMYRWKDAQTGEMREAKANNVKSVVVHMDEATPHIHAFIVPLDDRGTLYHKYYLGGKGRLAQLQNDYAKAMKPFGLERGEYYSVATAEQVSKYYRELKKSVEAALPEVKEGEKAADYKKRADEIYQRTTIHHRDEIVKLNQKHIRDLSRERTQYAELKSELKKETEALAKDQEMLTDLARMTGDESYTEESRKKIYRAVEMGGALDEILEEYPDRYTAMLVQRHLEEMYKWYEEERKQKKEFTWDEKNR